MAQLPELSLLHPFFYVVHSRDFTKDAIKRRTIILGEFSGMWEEIFWYMERNSQKRLRCDHIKPPDSKQTGDISAPTPMKRSLDGSPGRDVKARTSRVQARRCGDMVENMLSFTATVTEVTKLNARSPYVIKLQDIQDTDRPELKNIRKLAMWPNSSDILYLERFMLPGQRAMFMVENQSTDISHEEYRCHYITLPALREDVATMLLEEAWDQLSRRKKDAIDKRTAIEQALMLWRLMDPIGEGRLVLEDLSDMSKVLDTHKWVNREVRYTVDALLTHVRSSPLHDMVRARYTWDFMDYMVKKYGGRRLGRSRQVLSKLWIRTWLQDRFRVDNMPSHQSPAEVERSLFEKSPYSISNVINLERDVTDDELRKQLAIRDAIALDLLGDGDLVSSLHGKARMLFIVYMTSLISGKEGDTYMKESDFEEIAVRNLRDYYHDKALADVQQIVKRIIRDHFVRIDILKKGATEERIEIDTFVQTADMHNMEKFITEDIVMRSVRKLPITAAFNGGCEELDDAQNSALRIIAGNGFSVLQGGPGSGKTHVIKALASRRRCLVLCAWNKACQNILGRLGQEGATTTVMTISSFILQGCLVSAVESKTDQADRATDVYVKTNKELAVEYVIIDEASVMTTQQLWYVLRRTNYNVPICLVGDKNQLLPVGHASGMPFVAIVNTDTQQKESNRSLFNVQTLTKDYRMGHHKAALCHNSKCILTGNVEGLRSDCSFVFHPVSITNAIRTSSSRKGENLLSTLSSFFRDFRVTEDVCLAHTNEDVKVLNTFLHHRHLASMKKDDYHWLDDVTHECTANCFQVGSRVMAKRTIMPQSNISRKVRTDIDDRHGLAIATNMEVGVIVARVPGKGRQPPRFQIRFASGKVSPFPLRYGSDFTGSYAMTVHRSQGSEYTKCYIVTAGSLYENARLLYVAATRAKEEVHVSSLQGFKKAIRRGFDLRKTFVCRAKDFFVVHEARQKTPVCTPTY